jgi:H+/Cl- antiporter ClcA
VWSEATEFKMTDLGKLLLLVGAIIIVVGAVLLLAAKLNLPLGRLPGDIVYRGKHSVFYFPIVTCIVISVILSLIFWLVGRWHR